MQLTEINHHFFGIVEFSGSFYGNSSSIDTGGGCFLFGAFYEILFVCALVVADALNCISLLD